MGPAALPSVPMPTDDSRLPHLTPQRVATAAALTLVAILGGLYWMYVRGERTYYVGRDLRLLGLMTAQLNDVIDTNQGHVRNWVRFGDAGPLNVTADCGKPDPSKLRLEFSVAASELPQMATADMKPSQWRPAAPNADATLKHGCADVPIDALLTPAFDVDLAGRAFDAVMVADTSGKVFYRVTPQQQHSFLFAKKRVSIANGGSTLAVGDLSALAESVGWRSSKPLDLKLLSKASRATDVTLAGESCVLFSEPYTFPGGQQWIVCGLVSDSRFRFDTMAIPTPVVMLATALALLAICSWPFLRIALINDLEPLTVSDAVLLAVCTIIVAAIATLAVLDIFAYHRLSRTAAQQLEGFAERIDRGYRDDVGRAAAALAAFRDKTRDQPWSSMSTQTLASLDAVKNYPYVSSFAWVDAKGIEQFKFAAAIGVTPRNPRVDVSGRQYFADASSRDSDTVSSPLWLSRDNIPYAIQWVRSAATGKVTAAIAEQSGIPDMPVVVMATELVDLDAAVRPPGVDFAIVDEQGNVVYHTDPERIGHENVFVETDQNRRLRSAVLGRSKATIEASYWGDNTEMAVRPLGNSPWTLVVFRAKRFVRVLNTEGVLLTILLLLFNALPYALLYAIILIAAPRYRAPTLWPDETRRLDYLALCAMFLLLIASFALAIYALEPVALSAVVFVFPAQEIASAYAVLHSHRHRARDHVVHVLAGLLTIALVIALACAPLDLRAATMPILVLAKIASILLLLAGFAIALVPHWLKERLDDFPWFSYGSAYRSCGALLLVIGAALPSAGFFKLGTHIEKELFVKGAQLRLASMIESRIASLAQLTLLDKPNLDDLFDDLDDNAQQQHNDHVQQPREVFDTTWCLVPPLRATPCAVCLDDQRWPPAIPGAVANFLPDFSEDFVEMRQLHASASDDGLWTWCAGKRGSLTLDRSVRLSDAAMNKLYPALLRTPKQHILLSSAAIRTADKMTVPSWRLVLAVIAFAILGFGFFRLATDFIARRLFLMGVVEPEWLKHVPLSPTLGDHVFVMRRTKTADQLVRVSDATRPYIDVSVATMDAKAEWEAALATIDRSIAGRNVRIIDFEYGIDNPVTNGRLLQWLERLLALSDRTIVIISSVSPAYVYTSTTAIPTGAPPAPLPDRWRAVIERFVIVTEEQLQMRAAGSSSRRVVDEFADELIFLGGPDDERPERVLDELVERAHTYFAGLWASCSMNERVLLYQLARNGLINGKDRRLVRRLMARGLIRRKPNLELFSEAFRRYVVRTAEAQEIREHVKALGGSRWQELRGAIAIVVLAAVLMLFATQKDLLTTVQGLVTSLTASVPLLIKLVGMLSDHRLDPK